MRRKTISKEKLLKILKIVGIGLAVVILLGAVGSLFSGGSGSSGGSSVPSRPSTPSINNSTTEGAKDESTEPPESTTESEPGVPDVPDVEKPYVKAVPNEEKFNVYVNAENLRTFAYLSGKGIGEIELHDEGNVPFVRFYGDGSSNEAYAMAKNPDSQVTGQYLVFAYRIPTSNPESHKFFDIYANTNDNTFSGNGDVLRLNVIQDGEWHVGVVDVASALSSDQLKANADGTYTIKKFRIDFFNVPTSTTSYIDVAYVGMCDNIDNARAADTDWEGYTMIPGRFGENDGSVSYVEQVDENGMTYYTVTSTTTSGGEKGYVFHNHNYDYIANTSKYIGIMYRNAPGGYAQIYCGSSNSWEQVVSIKDDYETSEGWKLMILTIDNELYKDSLCKYLKFDFLNGLEPSTEYSMDFAFVKFFSSPDEAQAYYQSYVDAYDLCFTFTVDGESYTAVKGMTWAEWCDSSYNTIGAHISTVKSNTIVSTEHNYDNIMLDDEYVYDVDLIVPNGSYYYE